MAEQVPAEPPADAANAISVVFKLPNGARIERRFLHTNSLTVSYYFKYFFLSYNLFLNIFTL